MLRPLLALSCIAVSLALTGCGEPRSILRKDPRDLLVAIDDVQASDGTNAVVLDQARLFFVLNGEDRVKSIGLLGVKAGSKAQADAFHQALAKEIASKHRSVEPAVWGKDGKWMDVLHWTSKTEPSLTVVPDQTMMAAQAWKQRGDFPGDASSSASREFGEFGMIGVVQDDEWLSNLQRETGAQAFLFADLTTGMHRVMIPYNLLRIAADKRNLKVNPNSMNAQIVIYGIGGDPQKAAKKLIAYLNAYVNGEKAPE